MTQTGRDQRPPIEIERPSLDSIEGRASLAFKLLAAASVAGMVLAQVPDPLAVSELLTASFNLGVAALAVVYLIEARGLDRLRPWAVIAIRPLLVLVAASALGAAAIAYGDGKLRIPFELAAVAWAWFAPHDRDVPAVARFSGRSAALAGAAAAAVAVMVFGRGWFGWGGTFDVHEPDLQSAIQLECGAPGAGPPPTIKVWFDWSWASTSPLPNAIDIAVIGWNGDDAQGRPLYVLSNTTSSGTGVYIGRQGYPSLDLAGQAAGDSRGSFRWGIELKEQRYRPGHIELELRRTQDNPAEPQPLTVKGTYVHLGLWRKDSPVATCAW